MRTSFFRRLLAICCVPGCLAAVRHAHADESSVAVRIESNQQDLQVFERTRNRVTTFSGRYGTVVGSSPVYDNLCQSTPCETKLAPRPYVLAVSRSTGAVVEGNQPIWLSGPANIEATYTDRSGWRAAGSTILVVGVLSGSAMAVSARGHATTTCDTSGSCTPTPGSPNAALLFAGMGTLVVSLIAGLAMSTQPDKVSFRVTPMSLSTLSGSREGKLAGPDGLALTLAF